VEHILLFTTGKTAERKSRKCRERAEEALRNLKKGGKSRIWPKILEDKQTKDKGGDLGWFAGQTVAALKAAFSSKGGISDVVEDGIRLHIIKVLDRETAHTLR